MRESIRNAKALRRTPASCKLDATWETDSPGMTRMATGVPGEVTGKADSAYQPVPMTTTARADAISRLTFRIEPTLQQNDRGRGIDDVALFALALSR